MNGISIVILLLLAAAVGFAFRSARKHRGKCSGCGGSCDACRRACGNCGKKGQ